MSARFEENKVADSPEDNQDGMDSTSGNHTLQQNESNAIIQPGQVPLLEFVRNYYSPSFKNATTGASKRKQQDSSREQNFMPTVKKPL